MARLIDADELIEHAYRDRLDSRELIADMINNAPTVKEIPVKVPLNIAIKALEQEPYENCVSRKAVIEAVDKHTFDTNEGLCLDDDISIILEDIPSVKQEPKKGHWSRKTKVDAYDIAGAKTWGIKCQCDRCDFTTIVVEDFGYYKWCPNCGAKMDVGEITDNSNLETKEQRKEKHLS